MHFYFYATTCTFDFQRVSSKFSCCNIQFVAVDEQLCVDIIVVLCFVPLDHND